MPWGNARQTSTSGYQRNRNRDAVIARDGGVCRLRLPGCRGVATTADHIVGKSEAQRLGWTDQQIDDPSNLQASCARCNETKRREQALAGRRPSRRREPEPHPGLKSKGT